VIDDTAGKGYIKSNLQPITTAVVTRDSKHTSQLLTDDFGCSTRLLEDVCLVKQLTDNWTITCRQEEKKAAAFLDDGAAASGSTVTPSLQFNKTTTSVYSRDFYRMDSFCGDRVGW